MSQLPLPSQQMPPREPTLHRQEDLDDSDTPRRILVRYYATPRGSSWCGTVVCMSDTPRRIMVRYCSMYERK